MADFDVTLGSNKGNMQVSFDKPTDNLTLKNQAPTKTRIKDFNDVDTNTFVTGTAASNNESILVYNPTTQKFELSSGNIRLRTNSALYSGLKYTVEGALIPDTNNAYDLGTNENRFRTLFLSAGTLKLGNLQISDTGSGTVTIIEEKVVDGVQQNVVVGQVSTQQLNTQNFLAANVIANVSLTTNSSKVFFKKGFTVTEGGANSVILASNSTIHANNVSIRNNLSVNGAITLRGSAIKLGDGGDVITLGASVNTSILPTSTNTFDLGSPSAKYANLFATSVRGLASPTNNTDAANKAYVDGITGAISTFANTSTMGTGVALNDGAVTSIDSSSTVYSAIDKLNETMFNVSKNTFVRDVTFVSDVTAGGAGTTVTLTLTVTGNANAFDVNWGDGNTDSNITDTTPSHTYATNSGSPFTVVVTAKNTGGTGEGSTASQTRTNYITIFLADPVPAFNITDAISGGNVITSANTGQAVYLQNNTANIPNTAITATFSVNWGDGSSIEGIAGKTANGGPQGGRLVHTYTAASGTGSHTITLAANTYSGGNPAVLPLTTTKTIKIFDLSISAPNVLSTKTIALNTSSVGTNPRVAAGFTTNSVSGTNAGDNVTRYTTSGAIATGAMSSLFYQAVGGTVTAMFDGNADGQKSITAADDAGTYSSLIIDEDTDFNGFNAAGTAVATAARIFAPGLFFGLKARVSRSALSTGLHSYQIASTAGNSNVVKFIKDNITATPTVNLGAATLTQASAGTLKYISGVPYYTNDATLTLAGVTLSNFTGQTYQNTTSPVVVENSTDQEGTSGNAFGTNNYTYANIDGTSTMLTSGTPNVNIGVSSPYQIGNLTVNVNGGGKRAELIQVKAKNSNGTGSAAILSGTIVQAYNGSASFDEENIPVADALGAGFDTDGKRIHSLTGGTPAFSNSTDYYATQAFTGNRTVAGTSEAIVRYDTLKHFTTNLSSGYLPAGPNLNTGRSGAQHFVFAFKRTTVSRFKITLTGKVSGLFIAVPGTTIDTASSLNGWIDSSTQYAGSGVPGANTGNGGNGSNGCAETGSDRIVDGTSYTNQSFNMTLGTISSSNSHNNQILISIVLNSDDSLTALSIGVPS